jgi:signal transduction histidine kinase/CheY-like chemotaxis protein
MEAAIDQHRQSQGNGRAKTPGLGRALREVSRVSIVAAAATLIALAWIGARDAIRAHRSEALGRVQTEVTERAVAFEEDLHRELLSLDQTLRILEHDWQRDPQHFDLAARAKQVVVITEVSLQIFVADAAGKVQFSTRPEIVGSDVSGRDYFRYEASLPADDRRMFLGELTRGQVTQLWQVNLVRRLDTADRRFSGVIAASYDSNAFGRFYREVGVGARDLIAVTSMRDGNAWTMTDPGQAPSVINLRDGPTFARMRDTSEGHWIGTSALDNVDRIYAFETVPDYGLTVVVGADSAAALAEAATWERNALLFTGGITALIALLAFALLRAQSVSQQQHETLAHERAILEATLTGMSDGIMMVDRELRLLAWNPHFPEYTGVPREILRVGLPMEDILRSQVAAGEFGPVDVEEEVARRMTLLRAGASMGTIERPRPGGRQLEIRRNRLPGGGFVTLYTDVTARRQTEERLRQAQTLAAVGRLTAGVAHDFNNLLAAISGNAEIMHEQVPDRSDQAPRLAVILQAARRGSDLVRRLLAFSRRQPLAPVLVDLNKVVQGMGGLLRATLGRKIKVETKLDADLWSARIDPVQIEHVILNLAINARDAMPDGGTLTIATCNRILGRDDDPDLPAGEYVVVAVSDSGTGMTEEVRRSAFEPFFTTKPPGQGSGLGLSQVYGVATQSGGGARIDSAIGKGTTVSALFPRATQDPVLDNDTGSDRAAEAPEPSPAEQVRRTVLVVDDEADCRDTIAALLTANGFTPVVADDALAALRLIDGGMDFHLLLVDLFMPDMSGAELARHARARRQSVPVVFLTGGDDEWISGERWVLMKPFLTRTLIDTVRAALGLTQMDATRYIRPQMV